MYDITPTVSNRLKVWPGDTPPSREILLDMAKGDNLTLSTLHATVHLGAHADAPSHYRKDAASIESAELQLYMGECEVVRATARRGKRVDIEDLKGAGSGERVLIVTGTFPDPESFNEDFSGLAPELIEHLAGQGTRLIGVDMPSVDAFDSKDLPAHNACLANDVMILEGLVLANVPAGRYELLALPLKLEGFDASPVRAVLRTLK